MYKIFTEDVTGSPINPRYSERDIKRHRLSTDIQHANTGDDECEESQWKVDGDGAEKSMSEFCFVRTSYENKACYSDSRFCLRKLVNETFLCLFRKAVKCCRFKSLGLSLLFEGTASKMG